MGVSESQIHRVRSDHQCETGVSRALFVFVPCRFARFVLEHTFFVKAIVDRWNFPLNHDGRNGTPSLIQLTLGIYSLKCGILFNLKKMHIGKKMH